MLANTACSAWAGAEYLRLLAQPPELAAQLGEFFPLIAGQPGMLSGVDLVLIGPGTNGLRERSTSLSSSSGVRPARTSSTIWRRNSGR